MVGASIEFLDYIGADIPYRVQYCVKSRIDLDLRSWLHATFLSQVAVLHTQTTLLANSNSFADLAKERNGINIKHLDDTGNSGGLNQLFFNAE
jgi:hypothetical protein